MINFDVIARINRRQPHKVEYDIDCEEDEDDHLEEIYYLVTEIVRPLYFHSEANRVHGREATVRYHDNHHVVEVREHRIFCVQQEVVLTLFWLLLFRHLLLSVTLFILVTILCFSHRAQKWTGITIVFRIFENLPAHVLATENQLRFHLLLLLLQLFDLLDELDFFESSDQVSKHELSDLKYS